MPNNIIPEKSYKISRRTVLDFIDKDISSQKSMLKSHPEYEKPIKWRIIGLRKLRDQVDDLP